MMGSLFFMQNPAHCRPYPPVFRRNTRLGLHRGPGSFVNCSDQPRRDFNSRGFFRIYRVRRVIHVRIGLSASIGIFRRIGEVLLCQPFPFLIIFRNVNALDLEDDRSRPIITAGDHDLVIIRPALHDRSTLQHRINIAADCVPGLATEFAIHQVVKIILLRCALQYEFVTHVEEGTGAGLGIGQILLLIIGKTLLFQNGDLTFVLYNGTSSIDLLV